MVRQKYFIIGLVIISVIYLGIRLYRLEELMTFHLYQGQHLLESYEMWKEKKIRLVGPPIITRNYEGRFFFTGSDYYYILAGLGVISGWNPLEITKILMMSEWLMLIGFIWWMKKKYGSLSALGVFLFMTTNKYFIVHSRFFWMPHFLLPLGVLGVIFLEAKNWFIFGLIWGLAFNFHQSAILWLIPLAIKFRRELLRIKNMAVLGVALFLGNLPYFIFEMKHNFYNFKTMWLILTQGSRGQIESHHLVFPLIVFGLWGAGYLIKKSKRFLVVLILINVALIVLIKNKLPFGHPVGWTYLVEKEIVKKILKEGCPKNFNVASTLTTNTISYDLRYLLTVAGCPPMKVEGYPNAERLFLVSSPERPPETERVWEVESFRPFKVERKEKIYEGIVFYELVKIN